MLTFCICIFNLSAPVSHLKPVNTVTLGFQRECSYDVTIYKVLFTHSNHHPKELHL